MSSTVTPQSCSFFEQAVNHHLDRLVLHYSLARRDEFRQFFFCQRMPVFEQQCLQQLCLAWGQLLGLVMVLSCTTTFFIAQSAQLYLAHVINVLKSCGWSRAPARHRALQGDIVFNQ